jgi:hypothetical protein
MVDNIVDTNFSIQIKEVIIHNSDLIVQLILYNFCYPIEIL